MINQPQVDMQNAEREVRAALRNQTPGQRCAALSNLYFAAPDGKRDVLAAVIIAHLTLRRPEAADSTADPAP